MATLKELAKQKIDNSHIDYKGEKIDVCLKQLSVKDSNDLFEAYNKNKTLDARKILISRAIVDNEGKSMFNFDEIEKMPLELAALLEKLVMDSNALSPDKAEQLKNG